MKTLYTESIDEAAKVIRRGGLVAFPTETVYGLGADVYDRAALERIFDAKGRPDDNPLIVHISKIEQIKDLTVEITESAKILVEHFFPGPLTVILRKSARVPDIATAGLETVAIRMPAHKIAHNLIEASGTPLAAPSANLSGKPSPTSWKAVREDLDGRIDCVLMGESSRFGIESTVVDCTRDHPLILRPGALTLERVREIVPSADACPLVAGLAAKSPGLRHIHYSPSANVIVAGASCVFENRKRSAFIGLRAPQVEFAKVLECESVESYAGALYEFFRECDREGLLNVFCEEVREIGIGVALMDRIRRAAEQ